MLPLENSKVIACILLILFKVWQSVTVICHLRCLNYLSLLVITLSLTDRSQVDDVTISQVESPVLIGRSEDLNEVTRLGVSRGVREVRVIRGHLCTHAHMQTGEKLIVIVCIQSMTFGSKIKANVRKCWKWFKKHHTLAHYQFVLTSSLKFVHNFKQINTGSHIILGELYILLN